MEPQNINNVTALFFSPTYTTRKITVGIAKGIAANLSLYGTGSTIRCNETNITTPVMRQTVPSFNSNSVVVFGVPVYIGRVPNLFRDYFASIKGNGAIGIPVVVYGNRAYDDALIELRDIMQQSGFRCIAAGAFIGEHSFSYTLGGGRPNDADLAVAADFGKMIAGKIMDGKDYGTIEVPGNPPPYAYYNAKSSENKSIDIRKVKPETDPDKCTNCGICAMLCPMGAIDATNCSLVTGICIKCCACVKLCRPKAKYFTDATYLEHKELLEKNFTEPRKEPELFLPCK